MMIMYSQYHLLILLILGDGYLQSPDNRFKQKQRSLARFQICPATLSSRVANARLADSKYQESRVEYVHWAVYTGECQLDVKQTATMFGNEQGWLCTYSASDNGHHAVCH